MKLHQIMFMTTLISGTVICISANSLFTAWLGLEINLMSMIPLMLVKMNKQSTEAAIKYFLSQALASLILIVCVILSFMMNEMISMENMEFLMLCSILIKIGAAPFHYWFPQVIELSEWPQCFILMTWQKIAPFILISTSMNTSTLLASLISAVWGALGGFNQISMKLILTYSSISHSGWMIAACYLNYTYWVVYFLIYTVILTTVITLVSTSFKLDTLKEMNMWAADRKLKFMLIMNMLSLGGLPPLLGFISKMMVIKMFIETKMILIIFMMVLSSLLSLYFYCRVIYSSMMTNTSKNIMMNMTSKTSPLWFTITTLFNLMAPLIMIM